MGNVAVFFLFYFKLCNKIQPRPYKMQLLIQIKLLKMYQNDNFTTLEPLNKPTTKELDFKEFFEVLRSSGVGWRCVMGIYDYIQFSCIASTVLDVEHKPSFSKIFFTEITVFNRETQRESCKARAVFEVFENLHCFLTVEMLDTKNATKSDEAKCIEIAKNFAILKFNHPLRLMQLKKTYSINF